jgi:hypothetical protein
MSLKRKAAMQEDDSSAKRTKVACAQAPKARPRAGGPRATKQSTAAKPTGTTSETSELAKKPGESFRNMKEAAASKPGATAGPPEASTATLDSTTTGAIVDPEGNAPKPKYKRKKLAPARPWPVVPTSVTASGPRSSHTEGKNYICVTRRTQIGSYLRRCKDVILKDG